MSFNIRLPDDFHAHLRQDALLPQAVTDTAGWFGRVLAMPNTVPPIRDLTSLERYRAEIGRAMPEQASFEPLLVFKVLADIPSEEIARMAAAGAVGGKLYPQGVTTNSADGVSDITALFPVIAAMEEQNLVLEIHAEMPGAFVLDREEQYLEVVDEIARRFPSLRIVVEHVSSEAAVRYVEEAADRIAATITVHHLLLTLDDVVGAELKPHNFCKPIAKRDTDRQALLDALLSGSDSFFFGSDSAPHRVADKECESGCAGIYTAPVAVPLLVELALGLGLAVTEEEAGDGGSSLEGFLSRHGAQFYGLPLQTQRLTLEERPWTVPSRCGEVVPFAAGRELRYAPVESGGKG